MNLDNRSWCSGAIGIRPYRSDDAPALAAAVQASLDDLRRWLPWAREAYGTEDARAWIENRRRAWDDGEAYSFAIVQASGDAHGVPDESGFLGGVGINRIDRQNRIGNVGYWVRTQATGQGVATTAVRLAARVGFGEAGLRRLEFLVSTANEASQRVAEKVGACREGVLRRRLRVREWVDDAFLYALFPEDLVEAPGQ